MRIVMKLHLTHHAGVLMIQAPIPEGRTVCNILKPVDCFICKLPMLQDMIPRDPLTAWEQQA